MTIFTNILYIFLAVVILLVMVVIHEFGHYTAGKLLDFKITEFSVGFGPKIFQKRKKNGELFSLRAIPLGGYCAFDGEDEEDEEEEDENETDDSARNVNPINAATPFEGIENNEKKEQNTAENKRSRSLADKMGEGDSFNAQKPWKRIVVLLSGALFNLLSAVIFSIIYISVIGYASPSVLEVTPNGSGYYNELRGASIIGADENGNPIYGDDGDEILAVNGKKISVLRTFEDLVAKVKLGETVTFTVLRDGQTLDVDVSKQVIQPQDGDKYEGFGFVSMRSYKKVGFGSALLYSVPFTGKMSWTILGTFGKLITGQLSITSLSGPVGTITQIADLSRENWRNILILLPLIASNLAVFNLLPIPALDGSKVVFTLIEWIRKKPINRKIENIIHLIGIAFIFALVIIVDLIRLVT